MKNALLPVTALLFGVALLLTGQGLQGTLLPVRASLENFSALSIGFIGGTYYLGFTLGCLKGGELVARVGHVRVFAAMAALASAVPLLHGMIVEPMVWSGFRFLTGFCFAVLYVVIESWLNELSTNENRSTVFSVYVVISLSVLAIGQMLLLIEDPGSLYLFAVAAVLVSVAVVPVTLTTAPLPQQPQSINVDLRRLFHISPAGTIASLGTGLANGAFWALAPYFTVGVTGKLSLAAWFMSAAVLGGALCQWPVGHLSDRTGRRGVLIACTLGSAIAAFLIVALAESLSFVTVFVLGAAWGAFAFPQYSIAVANANDFAEPGEYVMVSSGLLLLFGIGAIAGPLLASILMTTVGDAGLFIYTGIIHILIAAYIGFRVTRRHSAPVEMHVDYNESVLAAHTTSQVYEEESGELQQQETS